MENKKQQRMLEIFFRAVKGEHISIKKLSAEYQVSSKSISRDISDIQAFLSESRDLMNNAELVYSYKDRCYIMSNDDMLKNKELFAVVKVFLGSRCFSKEEILTIISKLKKMTTFDDRKTLDKVIKKEIYHYKELKTDCHSVIDNLWKIINAIDNKRCITITYLKMDRSEIKRKVIPVSIMFSEYYLYLIAYNAENSEQKYSEPRYYRIDRITYIAENRDKLDISGYDYDEGMLRKKNLFMFPGKTMKVRIEFSGPSVQAVLDRLPTAIVVDIKDGKHIIEAEVNSGTGFMMYILSQGDWVKVLSPQCLVDDMKAMIDKMKSMYESS